MLLPYRRHHLMAWVLPLLISAQNTVAASTTPNSWYQALLAGIPPTQVAAVIPETVLEDLPPLNTLRLRLKTANQSSGDVGDTSTPPNVATELFVALAARKATTAVLLNLSLTYVDQLLGKNLLQQGFLSTRSQNTVTQIIELSTRPAGAKEQDLWLAWYIKGINNLYWPDWFNKATYARDYLQQAIAISQRLPALARETHDMYALAYLSLGDAYALLGQPTLAYQTWNSGRQLYPYVAELSKRLAIPEAQLHTKVRALRDANQPIDTDLKFIWDHLTPPFTVTLTGGDLYGPGPLEDQPLKPGRLANLYLGGTLAGSIPAFNNGALAPNLPGEILQSETMEGRVGIPHIAIDGLFSDGTPANENIDVGFVKLMHGKFNLFLAAVQDGPQAGRIDFFLDDKLNWTIHDDIGIDPGFPIGVIKIYDFTFSTSPRLIPISLQTENAAPAGVDRAGRLDSGTAVLGLLGDDNFDGYLDGILNAIGRFAFDSIILPGAPFAQTRVFTTNIPVTPQQAIILTLRNALAILQAANHMQNLHPESAKTMYEIFAARMQLVRRHIDAHRRQELHRGGDTPHPHLRLPPKLQDSVNKLTITSDNATICAMLTTIYELAPTYGLIKRDFSVPGIITTTCPQ